MFDLSNLETYNNLKKHLQYINWFCKDGAIVTLVGTKSDLSPHQVNRQDVEEWLDSISADKKNNYRIAGYVETSSITGVGVDDAFKMAFEAREKAEVEKSQVMNRDWAMKDPNRKVLIEMLEKITNKPEPQDPNSKADYFLAAALLSDLCNKPSIIGEIFGQIEAKRDNIIIDKRIYRMPGYDRKSIDKNVELSNIISKALSISEYTAPLRDFNDRNLLANNKKIFLELKNMIETQLKSTTSPKNPWPLGWAGSNSRLRQGDKSYAVPKTIMDVYNIVSNYSANESVNQGTLKQSRTDLAKITKMLTAKTSSKNPMLEAVISFFKRLIGVQRSEATVATYKSMLLKVNPEAEDSKLTRKP